MDAVLRLKFTYIFLFLKMTKTFEENRGAVALHQVCWGVGEQFCHIWSKKAELHKKDEVQT